MRKKGNKRRHSRLSLMLGIGTFILSAALLYIPLSKILTTSCANSISCEESFSFKVENEKTGVFNNQKIKVPPIDLSQSEQPKTVLGAKDEANEKRMYINLATQTLSAYEGDTLFMESPVSTGLWGRTPTGEFTIWIKIRSTTMSGGSGDDYYYLPNVPYVMFFSNNEVPASRGYGIHGAYWHNNFGHPMSHGCINMRTVDVVKLYEWVGDNLGTKIIIVEGSEI